jgi:hypothetical protein
MFKKIIASALMAAFASTPIFGIIPTAKAGAPLANHSAFRIQSSSSVYWHADGKRYPFPNAKTYSSWFNSFDDVRVVHDSYLEVYPLANENITYRPGAKLVKIQTAPEVYAVARGGVLRHITSESVARDLYGEDWNLKIDDIPDVFFANYAVGIPIYSAADYRVSNEYNSADYPHESLESNASPNSYNGTSGESLTFAADRTNITSGQAIQLYANYYGAFPSGSRLEIQDDRTETVVKSCRDTVICNMIVYPVRNNNESNLSYSVIVRNASGDIIARLQGPTIYFTDIGNTLSLATPAITSPYQDQVFTNYPRTLTVQWTGNAKFHTVNYEICFVGNTSCSNMSSFELQNFDNSYTFTAGGVSGFA